MASRDLVPLTEAHQHRAWAKSRYLRGLVATRAIPFHKIRGRIYFDLADLDRFAEERRVEPPKPRRLRAVGGRSR
jgi:hypothetical protein